MTNETHFDDPPYRDACAFYRNARSRLRRIWSRPRRRALSEGIRCSRLVSCICSFVVRDNFDAASCPAVEHLRGLGVAATPILGHACARHRSPALEHQPGCPPPMPTIMMRLLGAREVRRIHVAGEGQRVSSASRMSRAKMTSASFAPSHRLAATPRPRKCSTRRAHADFEIVAQNDEQMHERAVEHRIASLRSATSRPASNASQSRPCIPCKTRQRITIRRVVEMVSLVIG